VVARIVIVLIAISVCAAPRAAAQPAQSTLSTLSLGTGKLEIGGFPMGGTFFVGGDDNGEVDFNVYSTGASLTRYFTQRMAIEGEFTLSFGLAQDVVYKNAEVLHVQMPNVWTYFGNLVWFPSGAAGKRLPYYVTGGIGAVSLQSRQPTGQFGYDVDTVGFETFLAENFGGGVKIFRGADAPQWGFRIDYRFLIVNANSDAPEFFAKTTSRRGHRIGFGIVYTAQR
jgi:hypothetical protein